MANFSQPEDFYVEWIAATEIPASGGSQVAPSNIIQVGDKLTLRTYFVYWGSDFWEKKAVQNTCEAIPPNVPPVKVIYYLEDLEKGGSPIKIEGGKLIRLTSLDSQMQADGYSYWWFDNALVYRSESTVAITTGAHGSGMQLELPDQSTEGTWQVTVVLNGGVGSGVSAFSTDMFVQVLA